MRKLIVDGNAVYELDENCMLTREIKKVEEKKKKTKKTKKTKNQKKQQKLQKKTKQKKTTNKNLQMMKKQH